MTNPNNQLNKPMREGWREPFETRKWLSSLFYSVHNQKILPIDAVEEIESKLTQTKSQIVEQILGELDFYDYGGNIKTIELKEYLIDLKNKL